MDTVLLLEQLANSTHYSMLNNVDIAIQSNPTFIALQSNNPNALQKQFSDIGFLANATMVINGIM